MKKKSSVKLVVVILLLCVVGGGVWLYKRNDSGGAVELRVSQAQTRDIVLSIDATGTVEPEDLVDVGARVSGEIVKFGNDVDGKVVDYGSHVKEGEMLALIDDEIPQSDLLKAKASLAQAQANQVLSEARMRKAERDWKRAERLGNTEALAKSAYDAYLSEWESAAAEVEVAKAGVVQAEATLRSAERNLAYCVINAPVTGVIIDRKVNIGQTVVSSMNASSLFLIAKDLKRMEVWASVNEADIGQISVGQAVSFTVDAFPGETFSGTVGKIRLNATMTQNVVTYVVEVITDNSSGRLLPYLSANLKFEVQRANGVLAVPAAALRFNPDTALIAPDADPAALEARAKVWVPAADGRVRPVGVKVGITDGEYTAVTGDLKDGQTVATGVVQVAQSGSSGGSNPFTPTPPRRNRTNQSTSTQSR